MTDIEKVARALCDDAGCVWDMDPQSLSRAEWRKAACAAIAAMQPAPQWQGIETAPRDGRAILVGCWVGARWSWWQTFADGGPLGNDGEFGDEPTHWADAPTPPAGGSDAER